MEGRIRRLQPQQGSTTRASSTPLRIMETKNMDCFSHMDKEDILLHLHHLRVPTNVGARRKANEEEAIAVLGRLPG